MDIRKIKKIIELVEQSDVIEIEISDGEERIRLTRGSKFVTAPPCPVAPPPILSPGNSESNAYTKDDADDLGDISGHAIRSPMVGVFYSSTAPGQPSFVKVGDKVSEGDTVCIIEAMKIMNQITSERSGTVMKILAENAQPVEYDQPLFIIE